MRMGAWIGTGRSSPENMRSKIFYKDVRLIEAICKTGRTEGKDPNAPTKNARERVLAREKLVDLIPARSVAVEDVDLEAKDQQKPSQTCLTRRKYGELEEDRTRGAAARMVEGQL